MTRRLRDAVTASLAAAGCVAAGLLSPSGPLEAQVLGWRDADPSIQIAQDLGSSGLYQTLLRLGTTASLMHTTAHPDDEHAAMLTFMSRGKGVRTSLLTLNRGEGGANAIGPELFDALGVIRTEELLLAGRHYGLAAQYFTTAVDYGFSKTLDEAFRSWDRESVLEDMVRIIRTERPMVVVSRFHGSARDGHGHHQAAGVLTPEAVEAAADPARFPRQIEDEGLRPWRVHRLFRGGVRADEPTSLELDVGGYASWLGDTYDRLAAGGLALQRSQTAGRVRTRTGRAIQAYELLDGPALPAAADDFFDGLDTSLTGIAGLTGESPLGSVEGLLAQADGHLARALDDFRIDRAYGLVGHLSELLDALSLAHAAAEGLPDTRRILREKIRLAETAFRFATGASLVATAVREGGEPVYRVAPGDAFQVHVDFAIHLLPEPRAWSIHLEAPASWSVTQRGSAEIGELASGVYARRVFDVRVPEDADVSSAYFARRSLRENTYSVEDSTWLHRAWTAPIAYAQAQIRFRPGDLAESRRPGSTHLRSAPGQFRLRTVVRGEDPDLPRGVVRRELRVVPPVSLRMDPGVHLVPLGEATRPIPVSVEVRRGSAGETGGSVSLLVPDGWEVAPTERGVSLGGEEETARLDFVVRPPADRAGLHEIGAVARVGSRDAHASEQVIRHPDLEVRSLIRPATALVRVLDLAVAPDLQVGYVEGVGDEIPAAINALGARVDFLADADLADRDLGPFDAIVIGTRAYAVRPALVSSNQRLLDYVAAGGHLILLYQTQEYDPSVLAPEHAVLPARAEEVSEEDSPVRLLVPDHPLLVEPNRIAETDFAGWIEQRGSKFFSEWGERFTSLVETHDRGQAPQRGIWLTAPHGEGHYTYVSLALHRQTPYGVPGAYRILANLLSYGNAR